MRSLVIIVCIVALASVAFATPKFKKFKKLHNKKYQNETHESQKLANFLAFDKVVEACNDEDHTHECGHNEHSDKTHAEREAMCGGRPQKAAADALFHVFDGKRAAPATMDWRTKTGVVGPVKNQGSCGSCYIFGATAALEGQTAIKKSKSVVLSEQQSLDCLDSGCNGGWPGNVFDYQKAGVQAMSSRPYTGSRGTCSKSFSSLASTTGYVNVNNGQGNDANLVNAIGTVGPQVVLLNATPSFMAYKTGVFSDKTCKNSASEVNHAVTAVGYDAQSYIIKNSWGPSWGDQGYIRMSRAVANNCGVASWVLYPNV
jgi:C1A family cysteine protease